MKKQLKEDIADSQSEEERLEAATEWEAVMEMVERRKKCYKQVSPCPNCYSVQVQLVNWGTDILKMKCRHCKHKFEKELK